MRNPLLQQAPFSFSPRQDSILLLASPGDLLLWDSRTIHGGLVGSGRAVAASAACPAAAAEAEAELARMAVTVAMVPRSRASEEVLRKRRWDGQRFRWEGGYALGGRLS